MIFLSHNSNDKPIVEQIAVKLSEKYGQENIFYDSWSIQPGDGIVDKMNEGLEKCKIFLFFVSKNSLKSKMVKMEWQNVIMTESNNKNIKFIPIKLDDSYMPTIITQNLYINLYSYGLEVATRQIIDVIEGNNNFQENFKNFSNLKTYVYSEKNKVYLEICAEHYMEPVSSFLLLKSPERKDIKFNCLELSYCSTEFSEVEINKNFYEGKRIRVDKALVPGFPMKFIVEFDKNKKGTLIEAVLHEKKRDYFEPIPLIGRKN